jgi:hypothetical protein
MTDSPSPADPGPVDPDVELASAHLDGEAGADERARVGDAAVAAHVAAFEDVAARIRDVPPAPAGLLDDQAARAMAAFGDAATVVPMARSGRASAWWQRIPLGAVAAALVVVGLIGAISLLGQGADDDDTATATLDAADAGDSGGGSGATEERLDDTMDDSAAMEAEGAPEAGSAGSAAPSAFADYDELAGALREELAPRPGFDVPDDSADQDTSTTARAADGQGTGEPSDPCGAVAVLGLDPPAVVVVRPVVVGSDEVTAVVHDAADGRRLVVVDDATCSVVLDRLL